MAGTPEKIPKIQLKVISMKILFLEKNCCTDEIFDYKKNLLMYEIAN